MEKTSSKLLTAPRLFAPFVSRRIVVNAMGTTAAMGALLLPKRSNAAINSLMCAPGATGGFGSSPSGAMVTGDFDTDYSDAIPEDGPGTRRLKMVNAHTGETFDEAYVTDGKYDQAAVQKFNQFCRDWRHDETTNMDPALMDVVWKIGKMLDIDSPFKLLSGYRNPATNASVGGAKQSQHMLGRANDITHPNRSVNAIHAAAKALKKGGVGKYTSNNFVHVDTGPVRYWGS